MPIPTWRSISSNPHKSHPAAEGMAGDRIKQFAKITHKAGFERGAQTGERELLAQVTHRHKQPAFLDERAAGAQMSSQSSASRPRSLKSQASGAHPGAAPAPWHAASRHPHEVSQGRRFRGNTSCLLKTGGGQAPAAFPVETRVFVPRGARAGRAGPGPPGAGRAAGPDRRPVNTRGRSPAPGGSAGRRRVVTRSGWN